MRTTIELPDALFRTLKARAGLRGQSLASVVRELIERGLRPQESSTQNRARRPAPPLLVPPTGIPIPAVTNQAWEAIETEEDEARRARST